jgi:UDP-glucose 4-epimerase
MIDHISTLSEGFHAGYGKGFSVLGVLDAVDKVTNMTIKRRLEGRRSGDPAMLISDNRAILASLDGTPRHSDLDGIVRDTLAWERKLDDGVVRARTKKR